MVLCDDIFEHNGVLLIGANTELTEVHIDFLKRKHVEEINIIEPTDTHVMSKANVKIQPVDMVNDVEEKYRRCRPSRPVRVRPRCRGA